MTIFEDIKMQYKIGGITSKLIIWNVALFIFSIVFYNFKDGIFDFPNWIALSSEPIIVLTRPWTLVSYAFFHQGFWHLLFNMLVLNFSGRLFLTFFTQKQLLGLYILSAIFAGFCFIIGFYILQNSSLLVGASAAIMALLVATTTYQPLMQIRLLIIGNVKLWHLTFVILLLDFLQIRLDNSGGHIAHLSGALFGYIYVRFLQNGIDIGNGFNTFIDYIVTLFKPQKGVKFKKVHVNPKKPTIHKESKIVVKDKIQQQIDEILDKISKSGYDSLTKEEKEFLFKAGNN